MKLITLTTALFATLATVSAQGIDIGNPQQGASVARGSQLTVEVIKNVRFPLDNPRLALTLILFYPGLHSKLD